MPQMESTSANATNVAQHYLVAMPSLTDPNFGGAVIYVAEHTAKGAMGLVVNRPSDMSLSDLLDRVDVGDSKNRNHSVLGEEPVFLGGPVNTDRGFVLHEPVGKWSSTLVLSDTLGLTSSRDILEACAKGCGPDRLFVSLGYAGWAEGQLDQELAANAWLTVPAHNLSLVFDVPADQRFAYAFSLLGVDPIHFMGAAGHA
jgi:putative transcriptional regulator